MSEEYSLLKIVAKLLKRWKLILGSIIVIGLVSIFSSLSLPDYYKATTIFYPAHPSVGQPTSLGFNSNTRYTFGTGEDLDRILSIANSNDLKLQLIEKFDLYTYYQIDPSHPKSDEMMSFKFAKLYSAIKTKFDAVQVSVEDLDPQFAADMCKYAREKIDELSLRLISNDNNQVLNMLQKTTADQDRLAQILSDSIIEIKTKGGIIDTRNQGEVLSIEYTKVLGAYEAAQSKYQYFKNRNTKADSISKYQNLSTALNKQRIKLKSLVDSYTDQLSNVLKLEMEYNQLINQNAIDKQKVQKLMSIAQSQIVASHVVEEVRVPRTKSRPRRSILVLFATLLGSLFVIGLVLFIESGVLNKWKDLKND